MVLTIFIYKTRLGSTPNSKCNDIIEKIQTTPSVLISKSIVSVITPFIVSSDHIFRVSTDPAADGFQILVALVKDFVDGGAGHFF